MSSSLHSFIAEFGSRANRQLQLVLPARIAGGERLLDAMAHSLLKGGKRVRPLLAYASATAIGGNMDAPALDASACAVECIHAYSLVHDDLPAMDDDDLRRGEPTCHIAFDEATAILAGDALQCLAFETLLRCDAPAELVLSLCRELARASGATGMVAGQAIDLAAIATVPDIEYLERMHNHKTGALIEAAVVMGARSSGLSDDSALRCLRAYAQAIGLSFQVQDDILDVTSETAVLGKRQGADSNRNKPTYVTLLGLSGAQAKARQLHQQALAALEPLGPDAAVLRELSAYIIERSA